MPSSMLLDKVSLTAHTAAGIICPTRTDNRVFCATVLRIEAAQAATEGLFMIAAVIDPATTYIACIINSNKIAVVPSDCGR